jgi:hypothetical protein
MKTREVTQSLRDHLAASGFFAATEVPLVVSGAYSAQQRADVYAIKLHEFARKDTRIYEVKVSRADFLADLDAGKAESYGDHARRVYYACPAGLIKKDEVPATVGLVTLNRDGAWRTVRAAAPTAVTEPNADLLLLMMARGYHDERRVRDLRDRIVWQENPLRAMEAKHLGYRIASRLAGRDNPRLNRAERLLAAVEQAMRRPDVDGAPEGRRIDRDIRAHEWDRDLDEHLKVALEIVKEARRMRTVGEYIARVTGGWLGPDDKLIKKVDTAVKS